ncbi:hypothetical protein C7C45_02205 [Micromonospora arborensis]|uniref:Uncharacterized protein n=1 Tax=Micromonospora arborensis TaxID=2116518 RepID=A0A318NQ19_9ACTN|nr:hypothetical protein [Micromonospora arborensis]PYC75945.1 hypothetical protein C7C45_02205 [Micromonospora arborensis]
MEFRPAFIAAPVLVMSYGIIRLVDGLDGERGPGPAWTIGHLAFIGALVAFISVFWQMRRMTGGRVLATVFATAGTFGALALITQFSIDLVAGFLATDNYGMSMTIHQVRTLPGIAQLAYDFGPYAFYLGQLALVVLLAVQRRVKVWTPVLVLADLATPFIDKDLIPLGSVLLLVSFLPLARRTTAATPANPVPALV